MRSRWMKAPILLLSASVALAQSKPAPPKPDVAQGPDGRLQYVTDNRGNRIVDFSYAGYSAGAAAIPDDVPVRVVVTPAQGDNTQRVQRAIDYVASLPADANGFRGVVLLAKGRFEIAGALNVVASGVVLRGSGPGAGGTTLFASGQDRRALIRVAGKSDRVVAGEAADIADDYVPTQATTFRVKDASRLKAGQSVIVRRPSTAQWIASLGMQDLGGGDDGFKWRPGSRDVLFDRTIAKVEGDRVTLDAPITTALDRTYGGGTVAPYTWNGRVEHVGVENLSCESAFDPANPKDEEHAWFGVIVENARDAWVRQVNFRHFAGGAVHVLDSCKQVTVEHCKSLAPVSEIGGYRRHTFFTAGQLTLFQYCYSEAGNHDFATGHCAAGPNAFVQCWADGAHGESGPFDSWASGVLYDNVRIDGAPLSLRDRRYAAQGAGWAAANSVLWNCHAPVIHCFAPPGARNHAFGCWAQFDGNGTWYGCNEAVRPYSLYYAQLQDRLGATAARDRADLLVLSTEASSSPTPEQAAALTAASTKPAPTIAAWIDDAPNRHPIPTKSDGAKSVDDLPASTPAPERPKLKFAVANGILTVGGKPATGGRQDIAWWRGSVRPSETLKAPSLTRFVPGRTGLGLTDDLEQLVQSMRAAGAVAIEHHYGLWYDRRRDDHERVRRMDGEVLPPFYEQPFARSGTGVAWDGLSKYDLTKYNAWYFSRLKRFADLAGPEGLLLVHQHFFQHNIIEAGAHWADCPWRSANNVNDTGFPEPPPYAGDKRIFMAEQFYDVTNAKRREIYRAYIRHCLDATADNSNVLHLTSEEFTGPLHFVQFWLDCIAEWERETGKHPLVGLSATKDVQDAILADPTRAATVDVIDIRYWWPQADGTVYAPPGGQNLAPRQWQRVMKPKGTSADAVVRVVREYRQKYPDKAVIYSPQQGPAFGEAVRSAGGSLADVK